MYGNLPKHWDEMINAPFYGNTWRYTDHPRLTNETAYVDDAPSVTMEAVNEANLTSVYEDSDSTEATELQLDSSMGQIRISRDPTPLPIATLL